MNVENISTHDLIVSLQQNCSPRARELMVTELLRRERLLAVNIKMIAERLAAYEEDERRALSIAAVFENAPLALIQLRLETGKQELGWVLKLLDDNKVM